MMYKHKHTQKRAKIFITKINGICIRKKGKKNQTDIYIYYYISIVHKTQTQIEQYLYRSVA